MKEVSEYHPIYLDIVKSSLDSYLHELVITRKIVASQITDNKIIINPLPRMLVRDPLTDYATDALLEIDLSENLDVENPSDAIQKLKTHIDNVLNREYVKRNVMKFFPTEKEIEKQRCIGRSAANSEEWNGFKQGVEWALNHIKSSL